MQSRDANPWIAYRRPRTAPRVRLFCFPYAGGSASIYRTWAESLPAEIEVCPVQPPGREGRIRETAIRHMDELADAMAEGLADELRGGPFAFFGHSLGAVAAFEVARRHRDAGGAEPVHLFVSAHVGPTVPWPDEPIHDLPNPLFRQRVAELNGTPAEVLEHPELMELVEPLLRADFAVNETYEYRPGPLLTCPVTALGGIADAEVAQEDLEPWREITSGPFRLRMLQGDHFFLQGDSRHELLSLLARDLLA
jgi:medium-chain acyl-[acyl-carrier-protein] hydrolase